MAEEIQLSLDKEKFMRYLAGEVSFEEWEDVEMLHSLMVSNPLSEELTEQDSAQKKRDSSQPLASSGPSPSQRLQSSPGPSTIKASHPRHVTPGASRSQVQYTGEHPGPSKEGKSTHFKAGPIPSMGQLSQNIQSSPGSTSSNVPRPIQIHPVPSMAQPGIESSPQTSDNFDPRTGQMLPPIQRTPQARHSTQGKSQPLQGKSQQLQGTPQQLPGISGHMIQEAFEKTKTPVRRTLGDSKATSLSSPNTTGSGAASQTSLGGNFLVILSDNSLVIKLPDIKKEVELDEEESREGLSEEVVEVESSEAEESDRERGTPGAQGSKTESDSTDTEIRKNVAELKKLGIVKSISQSPMKRIGAPRGPRVPKVPKHLAGLMGEANLCYARGEYEDAATMCLEVVRQAPKCPDPYQLLSLLYEEKGEHEQSLEFALLGAHLNCHDTDEWQKVIDMCMDQGNKDMALYCYSKAIKYTKSNEKKVPLLREKINLLKETGAEDRIFDAKRTLLRSLPKESFEEHLQLAREMTKSAHMGDDDKTAMQIMSEAIEKHREHIAYEDINMMAELLMGKKDYSGAVDFLVKYCGVVLNRSTRKQRKSGDAVGEKEADQIGLSNLSGIVVPDELPIDLKVILAVCLIHLDAKQTIVQLCLRPLFKADIAYFGDLYLDVAEAYTEKGSNKKARPILAQLVKSDNFNQPAVWLRYADCLNSLGDWTHAAVAYKKVVQQVPSHLEARLSLATIEQQAGRTEAALQLLSSDGGEGGSNDIQLAYRKCLLLHNTGNYEEFADLAISLLMQYYYKGNSGQRETIDHFAGDIRVISATEWYSLLVKTCMGLKSLGRYQELSDIAQLTYNHERNKEVHDRTQFDNMEFLLLFAYYFNKDFAGCYDLMKGLTRKYADNNRFMNLFSLVTNRANESKHYRFCLRMTIKFFPENQAFCYMNGFNTMVRGSYKHALGELVRGLRQDMENPIINMCIGLCFFHLANQKYMDKKHSIILQGFAFLKRYESYRGVCQETYYNLGRALHGAGLSHLAVHYYHKALEVGPSIPGDDRFDLRREVAHNLSLIYMQSNNREMATELLNKYCVI